MAGPFRYRVWQLHSAIYVNPTMEIFEHRLREWPSLLASDKELLCSNTCEAIAAESSEDWERASDHYNNCFETLVTNKTSIPQPLLLWLLKRICLPLAFICQFRLRSYRLAFTSMQFMYKYVLEEHIYEDSSKLSEYQAIKERYEKRWVELMMLGVWWEALLDDGAKDTVDYIVKKLEQENYDIDRLGESAFAHACELQCIQNYKLGQFDNVWRWHRMWKSCVGDVTDERLRKALLGDCLLAEATLLAEHGEVQKSEAIRVILQGELDEDGPNGDLKFARETLIHLARRNFLKLDEYGDAERELMKIRLMEEENFLELDLGINHDEFLSLSLQAENHLKSARFSGGRRCAEDANESHQPECPTEFFTKRRIESGGGNLNHLETALAFLTEALDLANYLVRSSGDTLQVADVHIFLANLHLLKAEHKCGPLMNSDPLLQITPEILNTSDCHTIQQVREFLQLNGISPEKSFELAHYHYRQCAQVIGKILDSQKKYGTGMWISVIEERKGLYSKLQLTSFKTLEYYKAIYDVLKEALSATRGEDFASLNNEFSVIFDSKAADALIWSERGRARLLEYQLYGQQPKMSPMEPSSDVDLTAFHLDDEVAWDAIKSSLDACGEGTVFLEYSVNESIVGLSRACDKVTGMVYAVKIQQCGSMIGVPSFVATQLSANPLLLRHRVEELHAALSRPGHNEAEIRNHLEELYQHLIVPVVELLETMQPEQKLVICPSQFFAKVPFKILRNPAEESSKKGYLFQIHTISITPSLRVLKYNEARYSVLQNMKLMEGEGAIVAMGDPDYKNPKMRLENSKEEVEFIARKFPNRCVQVLNRDATVECLLNWAKLPAERSRAQAFVHIAAHGASSDAGDNHKHGILRLTDRVDPQCQFPDGILTSESIVNSGIKWRARMIVLSACSSGEGEIKTEGVLNLPRAFMVAGVPCSVVSQWPIEDNSTKKQMKFFYQGMLKGMDVTSALQSSMQQMLDKGYNIKQLGAFMVWGLPTVRLPDELLSKQTDILAEVSGEPRGEFRIEKNDWRENNGGEFSVEGEGETSVFKYAAEAARIIERQSGVRVDSIVLGPFPSSKSGSYAPRLRFRLEDILSGMLSRAPDRAPDVGNGQSTSEQENLAIQKGKEVVNAGHPEPGSAYCVGESSSSSKQVEQSGDDSRCMVLAGLELSSTIVIEDPVDLTRRNEEMLALAPDVDPAHSASEQESL